MFVAAVQFFQLYRAYTFEKKLEEPAMAAIEAPPASTEATPAKK